MARKTKAQKEAEAMVIFYAIVLFIFLSPALVPIWWVQNNIKSKDEANLISICIGSLYLIIVLLVLALRHRKRRKEDEITEETAAHIILSHQEALGLQCLHKLRKDIYGTENTEKWEKEIHHFFDTQLSHLNHHNFPEFYRKCLILINRIGARERHRLEEGVTSDPDILFSSGMSGLDFENYCGTILRKAGWEADVTRASGDQGADIIGRKGEIKAVFQCKLYKKRAVGNAAVQQAHTAMLHYRADMAVVIGDTGFSEAAEVLATTTHVQLLDHRQLYAWASSLGDDTK